MSDLIYRLKKRAEIRRQIQTRKSVQEGAPDRISDLLEEAAKALEEQEEKLKIAIEALKEIDSECYRHDTTAWSTATNALEEITNNDLINYKGEKMLTHEEKEEILAIKVPRDDKSEKIIKWAIDYAMPALFKNFENYDAESIKSALDNIP